MTSGCPGSSPDHPCQRSPRWRRWIFPVAGLIALVWFLVRVVPKPTRATYPCQRASMPLAAAFVTWIAGLVVSTVVYRRGRRLWRESRWMAASVCLVVAAVVGGVTLLAMDERPALADQQTVNDPIGVARGLNPGRVVWVHDPAATNWEGPGHGHWWEPAYTDAVAVDQMMSAAVCALAGTSGEHDAWDSLIRHFNITHGKGDIGYAAGEKITIKVNFVGFHNLWHSIDMTTYDMIGRFNYMNTSPQVIRALLRQLIEVVGVAPEDITIGDPQGLFPNQYHDPLYAEFPGVKYLDHLGGVPGHEREPATYSSVPFYWSHHPDDVTQDYLPTCFVEAEYFIDLANFKSHHSAGVTLCAKNHYGTLIRVPNEDGYYDMHDCLAATEPSPGQYRGLVDLLGHAHTGGKALLYLIDGLYAGVHPDDYAPIPWDAAPFEGHWTSSLFASQDPIAIDSVGFDFMQLEGDPRAYPQQPGADDFLHEGALAHDPPSGSFYDPDHLGDVTRLESLGVHEHWNNPVDRQYTRNLGIGDGIELLPVSLPSPAEDGDLPSRLSLWNYPNPFNPRTVIACELPVDGPVTLDVFALDGRRVARLIDAIMPAGRHETVWTGKDDGGRNVASGSYLYRLQAGSVVQTRSMTLIR